MFTCRTGTKFAYGKSDPTAHPGSSAGGWKGGSLGLGPGDTVSGSCFLSTSSQLQMSSQGVERWPSPVHAWMGGLLTQPGKSCSWALVTPLTTKQYHSASENKICIYVTSPSSPALPPVIPGGLCYRHGATVVACWLQANICWGSTTLHAPGETRGGGGAGVG